MHFLTIVLRDSIIALWYRAFVSVGANEGNCVKTISKSCQEIASLPNVREFIASSLWRTSPVGVVGQEDFLNMVCSFFTALSPHALHEHLMHIECSHGREDKGTQSPRTIDLDLLTAGQCLLKTPSLTLPHPRMFERLFVLLPLAELLEEPLFEFPTFFGPQKVNISDHIHRLRATTDQRAEKFSPENGIDLSCARATKEFVWTQ